MHDKLIKSVNRDIVLTGDIRYGVARNVPAEDDKGRPVRIAMIVIERANGAFQTVAVNEELIRFAGEGIIKDEVMRAVGL